MTGRPAAPLQQRPPDRKPRIVEIEVRTHLPQRGVLDEFGIRARKAHGIAAARISITLPIAMEEVEDPTLRDHDIVIERLLQALPEFHRILVEVFVAGEQIV